MTPRGEGVAAEAVDEDDIGFSLGILAIRDLVKETKSLTRRSRNQTGPNPESWSLSQRATKVP